MNINETIILAHDNEFMQELTATFEGNLVTINILNEAGKVEFQLSMDEINDVNTLAMMESEGPLEFSNNSDIMCVDFITDSDMMFTINNNKCVVDFENILNYTETVLEVA